MKNLFLLLAIFIAIHTHGLGEAGLPYREGFGYSLGYAFTELTSPLKALDSPAIVTNNFPSPAGGYNVYSPENIALGFDTVTGNNSNVWWSSYSRVTPFPAVIPQTNRVPIAEGRDIGSDAASFFVDTDGKLWAISNATWIVVQEGLPLDQWCRFGLYLSYDTETYDIYSSVGEDALVRRNAEPLPFSTNYKPYLDKNKELTTFSVYGDTYLDEIRVTHATIWNGSEDTLWENTANWTGGVVPDSISTALIRDGTPQDPIISSTDVVSITDLMVEPGATIKIESSSSSTGTLIIDWPYIGESSIISERYLLGNRTYILGPPVAGQGIEDFILSEGNTIATAEDNGTTHYGVVNGVYNESENKWGNWYNGDGTIAGDFLSGSGYLVRRGSTDGVVSFEGSLRTDQVDVTVTSGNLGWNSLANPYTAPMRIAGSADAFLAVNSNNIHATHFAIYTWDGSLGHYRIVNNAMSPFDPPGRIQSGQGFIVRATNDVTQLSFTPAMRMVIEEDQPGIMSGSGFWPGVRLNAQIGTGAAHAADILFANGMRRGLDRGYDAGAAPTQRVFTRMLEGGSAVNLGMQCLPLIAMEDAVVPVGLAPGTSGEVTFSLQTSGLPDYVTLRFEDRASDPVDGDGVALFQSQGGGGTTSYTAVVDAEEESYGRFYLVFEVERTESGIPVYWLEERALATDGSMDYEKVGDSSFTVYEEWVAGTNPGNPADVLRMIQPQLTAHETAGRVVRWRSVPHRTYTIERSTNLAAVPPFEMIATGIAGRDGETEYIDATADGSGPYFYRVIVELP